VDLVRSAGAAGGTVQREGIAFSLMGSIAPATYRAAVERYGSAQEGFRIVSAASDRRDALATADAMLRRSEAVGATILLQGDAGYPAAALDLAHPPRLLFALGSAELLRGKCVGIVGTRHSSTSGDRIAWQIAGTLARAGAVVVSGMAFGIDAAAHRGAMDAGGGTIAVLGGGADVPYPRAHAGLHERIVREGVVISEMPLGARPGKGAFPRRNRIIAALAETLVVIEAGERSGALITARNALDLGRNVAVVPGPIDSPRHVGSNRLLADGASIIARVEDVLSIAGIETARRGEPQAVPVADSGDRASQTILEAVRAGASDIEDLGRTTRLPARDFASAMSALELAGRIEVSPTGAVKTL
jgi:DNA processing protein